MFLDDLFKKIRINYIQSNQKDILKYIRTSLNKPYSINKTMRYKKKAEKLQKGRYAKL